jgi:hypothetical protein
MIISFVLYLLKIVAFLLLLPLAILGETLQFLLDSIFYKQKNKTTKKTRL